MKISNKNLLIIILVIVIILFGILWLNQNDKNADSEAKENKNELQNTAKEQENQPRLQIVFPGNRVILNPGSINVAYVIQGDTQEAGRVDITLFKKDQMIQRQFSSFGEQNKTGNQFFPNLDEGEYRITARLMKKDGGYFNTSFSEANVSFLIEKTIVNG